MGQHWFRVGALVEWVAAAIAVLILLWLVSVPLQRLIRPGVQAAVGEPDLSGQTPAGVPAGATLVSVMLLQNGGEVRHGDLHSGLEAVLPPKLAAGPPVLSSGQFGDRHTHAYRLNGTRIYVVCERTEPNGQMKVNGIYLP